GLDVAGLDECRSDRGGQRPDAPFDQALDRREPEGRTLVVEGLRDAPRDRVVVRDAEDQRLLAVEQPHRLPPCASAPNAERRGGGPSLPSPPCPPTSGLMSDPSCNPPLSGCGHSYSTRMGSCCIAGSRSPAPLPPSRPSSRVASRIESSRISRRATGPRSPAPSQTRRACHRN